MGSGREEQSNRDGGLDGLPLHVGRPNIGSRETFFRLAEEMFDRGWLTNDGPLVRELERRLAARLGVAHCVATCNATVALEIAIRALDWEGEVIVPSYTFIATAHVLHWQRLRPVFADVDPATHNLDPAAVRRAITARTRGILAVHLWGRSAPVEALADLAKEHRIDVLYDAAHAFGVTHGGQPIGGLGRAAIFSFHATKVFNTFEGGAIATNDSELAGKVRLMRNFGFAGLDHVIEAGTNGKMPEICAAMGLVNLDAIDSVIATNLGNYRAYQEALAGLPGISLLPYDESEQNNYQYVVVEVGPECRASRDEIVNALNAQGILARRYFWPGCHRMEPYRREEVHLPNTELVAGRVVVLPTGISVTRQHVEFVAGIIRRAVGAP